MPSISEAGEAAAPPQAGDVIVERRGALGHIRLNRPKALNSLTFDMVRSIASALDDFGRDPDIIALLVSGEGERGFCAGGDIRMIYDAGRARSDLPQRFWRTEYRLNAQISHYPKPYIALMDGLVMGGGAGISVHGSHRIVTERTRFAMPETGIGFFPDVGASWFLTRGRAEGGTWLGLTGHVIGAGDAIGLGLADIFVPSERLPELAISLADLPSGSNPIAIAETIARFADEPPPSELEANRQAIDRLFAFDRVEDILAALDRDDSAFAVETAKTLRSKSPLSLAVTLRLLRLGQRSDRLEDCLQREFAATAATLENPDFYEGIRAAVIDKDRNPKWHLSRLADLSPQHLEAFFPVHGPELFAVDPER